MNVQGYVVGSSWHFLRSGFKVLFFAFLIIGIVSTLYYFYRQHKPDPFANEVHDERLKEHRISGRVVRITDGDTFEMLAAGNKKLRVRIHGIDAPEREQPFYRKSRDLLGTLCFQEQVSIQIVNKDRWGRLVAHAFTPDGQSIGYKMVENGFAWHFTRYSNDPTLRRLENSARKSKAGLWADKNPVAPWKWRRGNKG